MKAVFQVGEKTIEVRKTRPKLEVPFKCYIYCTKAKEVVDVGKTFSWGKEVIGEFICDSVYEWSYRTLQGINGLINTYFPIFVEDLEKTCLTHNDIKNYGKGKTLYAWHISDIKIYDEPKELSEFWTVKCTSKRNGCIGCEAKPNCIKTLERPPQSWQYVEDLGV